jgi:thiol-disulfide isomerase/thioredoxin
MRSIYTVVILVFGLALSLHAQTAGDTDPSTLQKDFTGWWNYYNYQTKLSADFISLDTVAKPMSKELFLKILTSGNYIPVRQQSADGSVIYQLYKLSEPDKGIRPTIQFQAEIEYAYYMMEGKELPDFNFTDIDGKVYNKETTKGKTMVLKCWFIHCVQCVEEIPVLNKMVQEYRNRKDVIKYAIVPGKQSYMNDQLKIMGYPTHLIIKDGVIQRMISDGSELITSLKKETAR